MKSVLMSALVLLTLVSCDSSTKKASEEISQECSINGQKVDCNAFKSNGEKLASLTVKAEGEYEIKNGKFRVLKSVENVEVKHVGGDKYECSVSFLADVVLDVDANERELTFSQDGQSLIYERSAGSVLDRSRYELGSFESMDSVNKIKEVIKLDSKGHITLQATCYY